MVGAVSILEGMPSDHTAKVVSQPMLSNGPVSLNSTADFDQIHSLQFKSRVNGQKDK